MCQQASIAQLGERKTEDLEALCSIHSRGINFCSSLARAELALSIIPLLPVGIPPQTEEEILVTTDNSKLKTLTDPSMILDLHSS